MGGIKYSPGVFLRRIRRNFGKNPSGKDFHVTYMDVGKYQDDTRKIQLFRTTAWMPNSRRIRRVS